MLCRFFVYPGYTILGAKLTFRRSARRPSGTRKTLLTKAVAGEANVPFFSMSGSDFVEGCLLLSVLRDSRPFRPGKGKAPCIVFIDEIDAVGRARRQNPNMGASDQAVEKYAALHQGWWVTTV